MDHLVTRFVIPWEKGDINKPFLLAVIDGDAEKVKETLSKGADVQALEGTALRLAAHLGHNKCVEILLEAKADVNARIMSRCSYTGFSFLLSHVAQNSKFYLEKGKILLYNRTSLEYAAWFDQETCVTLLLAAGARIDIEDGYCNTVHKFIAERKQMAYQALVTLLRREIVDRNMIFAQNILFNAALQYPHGIIKKGVLSVDGGYEEGLGNLITEYVGSDISPDEDLLTSESLDNVNRYQDAKRKIWLESRSNATASCSDDASLEQGVEKRRRIHECYESDEEKKQ
jgi:hypothetical protein